MKKLISILLVLATIPTYSQPEDCENFKTVSASYILTKTAAVSYDYFTDIGLTAFGGVAYTPGNKKNNLEQGEQSNNIIDIFAGIGYRIYRADYTFSWFVNGGVTMGDSNPLQPFLSTKFLFPAYNKAYSIEPIYVFGRGVSAKLSVHFRL